MCEFVNNGKHGRLDKCMKKLIKNLNDYGIETVACCCGHGWYPMTILIRENGVVRDVFSNAIIPRKRRFYVRDKDGIYYVPESLPMPLKWKERIMGAKHRRIE